MSKTFRSVRSFTEIADLIAAETMTETDGFYAAFSHDLEGVRIGHDGQELSTDMPDGRAAQLAAELIVTTLFDLFRDTRLEPAAERLAWGIVGSFHRVADQWARQADSTMLRLQDVLAAADGSEINSVETEETRDRLEFEDKAADALACMRDHIADIFLAETGKPWSPPKGSLVSSKRTASVIASTDFLRARRQRQINAHNPQGPKVIFSGGREGWFDEKLVWRTLDEVRARHPGMVMMIPDDLEKGGNAIAASWAAKRKVAMITFGLSRKLGKRAGFVRNEQMVGIRPACAVVLQGSGLQSHLARIVEEKDIPATLLRLADQDWTRQ